MALAEELCEKTLGFMAEQIRAAQRQRDEAKYMRVAPRSPGRGPRPRDDLSRCSRTMPTLRTTGERTPSSQVTRVGCVEVEAVGAQAEVHDAKSDNDEMLEN